jgi:hypothetical protein
MDEYVDNKYENIINLLVSALNFYADKSNYESKNNNNPAVIIDNGEYAKTILGLKQQIEKEISIATLDYDNYMEDIKISYDDLDDVKINNKIRELKGILKKYSDEG